MRKEKSLGFQAYYIDLVAKKSKNGWCYGSKMIGLEIRPDETEEYSLDGSLLNLQDIRFLLWENGILDENTMEIIKCGLEDFVESNEKIRSCSKY